MCFVVSLFVRLIDVIRALLGQGPRIRCVVLNYHTVKPAERQRFADQMDLLVRVAKPIRADVKQLPDKQGNYVVVTFDDGLEGVLDHALPELEKRAIPATIFIVTETMGEYAKWDDMGAADAVGQKAMSLQQLQLLPAELITIGSHSMTHPFLPSISKDEIRQEVLGSRTKLEQLLKREVRLFSCPYGVFNSVVVESCREAGYERVFTGLATMAFSEPNEFVTGRVRTTVSDWPIEFRLKLAGAYRWLPTAIAWKRVVASRCQRLVTDKATVEQPANAPPRSLIQSSSGSATHERSPR